MLPSEAPLDEAPMTGGISLQPILRPPSWKGRLCQVRSLTLLSVLIVFVEAIKEDLLNTWGCRSVF